MIACFCLRKTRSRDLNSPYARSAFRAVRTLLRRVRKGAGKGPLLLRQVTGCQFGRLFFFAQNLQQSFFPFAGQLHLPIGQILLCSVYRYYAALLSPSLQ